jgi:thiol-disulfide isomerase/thioredoxin
MSNDKGVELNPDERHDGGPKNEAEDEMRSFLHELHDGGKIKDMPFGASKGVPGVHNTGVKGVLTDYKFAKQEAEAKLQHEQEQRAAALKSNTIEIAKDENPKDEDLDALLNDDDDEILAAMRSKAMEKLGSVERMQLQGAPQTNLIKKKKFGKIFGLSRDSFVDAIDREPVDSYVVIHLFQPHIAPCLKINSYLGQIARKYPLTKFCTIKSTDAKAELDEIGLPVVLVYRAGELIHNIIRVHEDLPQHFDIDDFDAFLQERGIVDAKDAVED